MGEGRALYNLGNVYHAQGKHLGRVGPQEPGGFSEEVKHCFQKAVEYYAYVSNMIRNFAPIERDKLSKLWLKYKRKIKFLQRLLLTDAYSK